MYSIAIYALWIGAWIASLFNEKVRKMVRGQRQTFSTLRKHIHAGDRVVWVHAASLGEFEQGRPIMERIRRNHPELKILLTFFSPSGYEVRKNYEGADVVCYLPFDTPTNALRFIRLARPETAIFIKYEFWHNYLWYAHHHGVNLYSVSSIFRPTQRYFKWHGRPAKYTLRQFDHFYVQDQQSKDLLATLGITYVTVTGDTRFDRVLDIRHAAADLPVVERFLQTDSQAPVFIAGSSWDPDEHIYIPYFTQHKDWQLIIAPHVISEEHLQNIEQLLADNGFSSVRYTQIEEGCDEQALQARVLIVNCFGKLSSIYRYGSVALVGGGFGAGIHNVPEAAVYGIPVLFGPNNKKFREAQALLKSGGSFEYADADSFAAIMDRFIKEPAFLHEAGKKAGRYISSNAGAADRCYKAIFES